MTKRAWTGQELRRLELLRSVSVPVKAIAHTLDRSVSAVQAMTHAKSIMAKRHVLDTLPIEVVNWLCDITPPGASMSDTVRSILQDAYDDATQ